MREKERTLYGVQCPRCHEEIYSMYRHDMVYCPCGYTFVDGGQGGYLRVGYGDQETGMALYGEPITVKKQILIGEG